MKSDKLDPYCDHCGKQFAIELKEKDHGKGIIETYFVCPHCDSKYTAFVTDPGIRRVQRKIIKIRDSITKDMSVKERIKGIKRMQKLIKNNGILMEQLKERYQNMAGER
jgi:transposase-like protein